eukprot:274356-Chlamydomonas_euryale.AAC.1
MHGWVDGAMHVCVWMSGCMGGWTGRWTHEGGDSIGKALLARPKAFNGCACMRGYAPRLGGCLRESRDAGRAGAQTMCVE